MKKEIKKHIWQWIPLLISLLFAGISLIIYTITNEDRTLLMYVQVTAASLVPAILPTISLVLKRDFPKILNVLITTHVILASPLGSALGFYGCYAFWDLLMHGYFGFLAAVTLYILLIQWNGEKLNQFGFSAMIFLGTLGGAAVWEIFEYTCDTLLGGDAQRVQEGLLMGVSPVKDTMTDIIIAIVGVAVFFLCLLLYKKGKARLLQRAR